MNWNHENLKYSLSDTETEALGNGDDAPQNEVLNSS